MSLILLIYLAGVTEVVKSLFFAVAVISGCFALVGTLHSMAEHDKPLRVRWYILPIVVGIVAALIPTQRTVYLMAAAGGLESLALNDRVQGIADNSLKLIEKTLGEYLNEMKAE